MNATHTNSEVTDRHTFQVELDGKTYDVVIWLNQKGKFIDDEISFNDEELEGEGAEGEIREKIIEYLSENWDFIG